MRGIHLLLRDLIIMHGLRSIRGDGVGILEERGLIRDTYSCEAEEWFSMNVKCNCTCMRTGIVIFCCLMVTAYGSPVHVSWSRWRADGMWNRVTQGLKENSEQLAPGEPWLCLCTFLMLIQ